MTTLIGAAYLIIGAFIAADHHYYSGVDKILEVASAVLAIILWPLVLLGVSMHL